MLLNCRLKGSENLNCLGGEKPQLRRLIDYGMIIDKSSDYPHCGEEILQILISWSN